MKTTVEISDALFIQARELAERERTTLRALIEEGLRQSIASRKQRAPFKLRRASYRGKGLATGLSQNWDDIRRLAYEGRVPSLKSKPGWSHRRSSC